MTPLGGAELASFAVLGLVGGLAYFWALRASLRIFAAGRYRPLATALFIMRLAAAGLVFWLIAGWGAAALVGTLLGFLGARFISLRWVLREPC